MVQIMRPYQLATVIVMAHPWVPDTGPILDLVAQAEGEPRAEILMGIDRVPGTRGIGSWTLEWTGTFASSLTTTPNGMASVLAQNCEQGLISNTNCTPIGECFVAFVLMVASLQPI